MKEKSKALGAKSMVPGLSSMWLASHALVRSPKGDATLKIINF